jgi:hypothetical protein
MSVMIEAFAVLTSGFLRGKPPKQNFPRSRPRRIQGNFPGLFSRSAWDCRDMVVRQEFRCLLGVFGATAAVAHQSDLR